MRKVDVLEHEFVDGSPAWRELWIGCIEGPALPEMSGRLVYRNPANIVAANDLGLLAAIEFGIGEHGVRKIVVCGHHDCGCLAAEPDGTVRQWLLPVRHVEVEYSELLKGLEPEHRQRRLCELNVLEQVLSATRTSVIREFSAREPITVEGAVYDAKRDEFVTLCSVVCPNERLSVHPDAADVVTLRQGHTF